MKRLIPFLFILVIFAACSEQVPEIPCLSCPEVNEPLPPDQKKVLIEEFTGVRCVQCPAGSVEIESLLDFYGEGMVAVSIHAGFFSSPFTHSIFDLSTPEGEALNTFLDLPQGYPTASINRKLFQGEDDLQLDRNSWGGYIAQELEEQGEVNLKLGLTYNSGSRVLKVDTEIIPLADITGELRISLMLTETDIQDVQLTPDGEIDDYTHRHVLRDMLTPFNGEVINEAFVSETPIEKTHSITLNDTWVANNMEVIVFVHRNGTNREVLQVETAHLPE